MPMMTVCKPELKVVLRTHSPCRQVTKPKGSSVVFGFFNNAWEFISY